MQTTALPTSRERADALRFALGDDAMEDHPGHGETKKLTRPMTSVSSRLRNRGGLGEEGLPSFRTKRYRSTPTLSFNSNRVVSDITRAVHAKAQQRFSPKHQASPLPGSGFTSGDSSDAGIDSSGFDSEWLPATTADGRPYFWNPVTRKARWTKRESPKARIATAVLDSIQGGELPLPQDDVKVRAVMNCVCV